MIHSSTSLRPVVYLDLLPFREELMTTLHLSQSLLQGPRYALHKWMAHARAAVPPPPPEKEPAKGSPAAHLAEVVASLDPGWKGELQLELEGTAEALHDLIVRCAGPHASSTQTRSILASVLDPHADVSTRKLPPLRQHFLSSEPASFTFPFHVLREKCSPGRIVLNPLPAQGGQR